jgi:hypothetical protein
LEPAGKTGNKNDNRKTVMGDLILNRLVKIEIDFNLGEVYIAEYKLHQGNR